MSFDSILVEIGVQANASATPREPLRLDIEIPSDAETLAAAVPQALAEAAMIAAERLGQDKWRHGNFPRVFRSDAELDEFLAWRAGESS